jgi:hypothetical protein
MKQTIVWLGRDCLGVFSLPQLQVGSVVKVGLWAYEVLSVESTSARQVATVRRYSNAA